MPHMRGLPPFGNAFYESEKQIPGSTLKVQETELIILEIHDGPAQTLASALQHLQTFDHVARPYLTKHQDSDQLFTRALGLVKRAIGETREIISGAPPNMLDAQGLVPVVRRELEQLEEETGCQIELYSDAWPNLPPYVEFAIYRIVHEAVNNVRKHAGSSRLEVEMSQKGKHLLVRVKDWGIGFIPDTTEPSYSGNSLGLLSMRRRTELLGGTFRVSSALGKGTEIRVNIPV